MAPILQALDTPDLEFASPARIHSIPKPAMRADKPNLIEAPELALRACSVEEHCTALRKLGRLSFWWYQSRTGTMGNFSLPFRDSRGNWWYQARAGFCWPVDCFRPVAPEDARPTLLRSYIGSQHIVESEEAANSHLVINSLTDLSAYDETCINAKRRNAIRKGLRCCRLEVLTEFDRATFDQCRAAWASLTQRTGWKHALDQAEFDATWRDLLHVPGVTIIVGRDVQSGEVAGFLMVKIIGDTGYVDTIASRTEMLNLNVNDAVMYAFLMNAKRLSGVDKAHYAIRSYVASLEEFKRGLGFTPVRFPAALHLRKPAELGLKWFFSAWHQRLAGKFHDETVEERQSA